MLFRKLLRTMKLYKAQFLSMVLMIALGIGVFVGFNMEWVSIEENMSSFFEETGFADYRIVSEKGFTKEDCEKISGIDGVQNAARYLSVNVDVKEKSGDNVALTITEDKDVSGFLLMEGEDYDKESEDGIWLSDQYARKNEIGTGDSLTFVYQGMEFKGTVKGLIKSGEYMICVRDESQLMPDFTTYGFAYISPAFYERVLGMDYYPQIHLLSETEKKELVEQVDHVLGDTPMILTKDETISYSEAKGEAQEGKTMGSILPVLFLLIAVLTMITTMHRIAAKEKTQIGTLKALGFRDKRILRHYTSYAFLIGVVGCTIGIFLGYQIAWFIMNPNGAMGTYLDLPEWKLRMPWFCVVILIGILILLTLIGYLSVKKMLKGTAADALRPYVPQKVKALLIERGRLFHRLSFGTRWNLRDCMRHKSRSAMSLLGIVGCTLLIVCALGMRDTMNAFLDMYYDGALGYESRIYLSENASEEEIEEVLKKYQGDWSASLNVQLEEKTVSLDIYGVSHDLVKFPDAEGDYISLKTEAIASTNADAVDSASVSAKDSDVVKETNSGEGAYICMRLADEFDLKPGDEFSVSPYGSDQSYTLKVAGRIRSVSENIVITPEYADEVGITYKKDSVYTNAVKEDIPSQSFIKSVQSKQKIMDSFDTFIAMMNSMIYILVLGAMLLGLIVLYNLGVMSYTERYREMATLKVVGFKDRKIGRLLIGQNLWMTFLGVLIGLPLGIGVLKYLLDKMASEYEMMLVIGPMTCILSVVLTFGVSLLVSFLVARKNRKIDMVEALKGAE